jgi:alpha-glucosidase
MVLCVAIPFLDPFADARVHIKINDVHETRYEVPEQVIPRPTTSSQPPRSSKLKFRYTNTPFSFSILRAQNNEILFDSGGHPLIFAPQYLRLKTSLPLDANIYGLGEHTDSFRLPMHNYTRTLWTRDSPSIPSGTNLYGAHPVYFEHRNTGTHGVLLLNSNGMDIKLDQGQDGGSLEYNVIGGVLDLYFFTGDSPVKVAQQYAKIIGYPAEVPYWSFGFHQCRWGYKDITEVAQVVANYSAAGIPLETMWTDSRCNLLDRF